MKTAWVPLLTLALGMHPIAAAASSAASLVNKGNQAFRAGNYDEAIAQYDKASVDAPESAHIYFNKATALYKKGESAEAKEMFEKAAIKSTDLALEARAKYGRGNCMFRESERQRDSDLKKSLEACQASIADYQEALKLDPKLTQAAENIEVARLTMKALLDEIKKKEEDAAKQQQQQQKATEELKRLIGEQEKAMEQSKQLSKEKQGKGDSESLRDKTHELGDKQKNIEKDTEKLADGLKDAGAQPQQTQSPAEQSKEHLKNAARQQDAAAENLDRNQPEGAVPPQEKALDEMKKAMNAMTNSPSSDRGTGQQNAGDRKQEQDQQPQEQAGTNQQQNAVEEAKLDEEARDVISEEKENRDRRRVTADTGEWAPVDKDW